MSQHLPSISTIIANQIKADVAQVDAAIKLLDDGASVPFIARYRKEATQGLTDTQLRLLVDELAYLRDLDARKQVILKSIRSQDKLTESLEREILTATNKTRLEDLYLPYRPKRRTKASLAKEAGLEPLALFLLAHPEQDPTITATEFITEHALTTTPQEAVEGARQILMELFAENADLLTEIRQHYWQHGVLQSEGVAVKKDASPNKYIDYHHYKEALHKIPAHRAQALLRGRRESMLRLSIVLPNDPTYGETRIAAYFNCSLPDLADHTWLFDSIKLAWSTKIMPKLELELLTKLRENADEAAIRVFATNLRDLLLAAPAGPQVTIGLDPGIRTGVKVIVVNEIGDIVDEATLYPLAPHHDWQDSITTLAKLAIKHQAKLMGIGNGTGSRETERLVSELVARYPDLNLNRLLVSEAGASVYSASALAAEELPELDVTLRGAASIARRVQDPLSELVKIEPKSIGVGQYQHDVNQTRLSKSLDSVIEDCVNAVGVDINLASTSLLKHVSGLNETLAKNLVAYRSEHGPFHRREDLKKVPLMGQKTFQQAAGFLRIREGDNPLDASGIHPEAYPIVEKMMAQTHTPLKDLIGNPSVIRLIDAQAYVTDTVGFVTVQDILKELEKPGRDPRPAFKTAQFKDGVMDINDLKVGMTLEGVVSNVTNFGAFIDIGVHQDGLVHISAMADRFISDPHTVVKTGDIVHVRVIEIDVDRRRINLSMKQDTPEKPANISKTPLKQVKQNTVTNGKNQPKTTAQKKPQKNSSKPQNTGKPRQQPVFNTAMADALSKLKKEIS